MIRFWIDRLCWFSGKVICLRWLIIFQFRMKLIKVLVDSRIINAKKDFWNAYIYTLSFLKHDLMLDFSSVFIKNYDHSFKGSSAFSETIQKNDVRYRPRCSRYFRLLHKLTCSSCQAVDYMAVCARSRGLKNRECRQHRRTMRASNSSRYNIIED